MKWFEALKDFWMHLLGKPENNAGENTSEVKAAENYSLAFTDCGKNQVNQIQRKTYPLANPRHGRYTNEEWWRVICAVNSVEEANIVLDVLEYCKKDYSLTQIQQYVELMKRRIMALRNR